MEDKLNSLTPTTGSGSAPSSVSLQIVTETSSRKVMTANERTLISDHERYLSDHETRLSDIETDVSALQSDVANKASAHGDTSIQFKVQTGTSDSHAVTKKQVEDTFLEKTDAETLYVKKSDYANGGLTLTNVPDGVNSKDAVNVKQLNDTYSQSIDRSNHTGTQSLDTITETNDKKILTADERAAIAGYDTRITDNTDAINGLQGFSNSKANVHGDAANTFSVANGTANSHAVNLFQLNTKADVSGDPTIEFNVGTPSSDHNAVTLKYANEAYVQLGGVVPNSTKLNGKPSSYYAKATGDVTNEFLVAEATASNSAVRKSQMDDAIGAAKRAILREKKSIADIIETATHKVFLASERKAIEDNSADITDLQASILTKAGREGSTSFAFKVKKSKHSSDAVSFELLQEELTDKGDLFKDRANHTGTQSLDTITETEALKVYTEVERALLGSLDSKMHQAESDIATNSSDIQAAENSIAGINTTIGTLTTSANTNASNITSLRTRVETLVSVSTNASNKANRNETSIAGKANKEGDPDTLFKVKSPENAKDAVNLETLNLRVSSSISNLTLETLPETSTIKRYTKTEKDLLNSMSNVPSSLTSLQSSISSLESNITGKANASGDSRNVFEVADPIADFDAVNLKLLTDRINEAKNRANQYGPVPLSDVTETSNLKVMTKAERNAILSNTSEINKLKASGVSASINGNKNEVFEVADPFNSHQAVSLRYLQTHFISTSDKAADSALFDGLSSNNFARALGNSF